MNDEQMKKFFPPRIWRLLEDMCFIFEVLEEGCEIGHYSDRRSHHIDIVIDAEKYARLLVSLSRVRAFIDRKGGDFEER